MASELTPAGQGAKMTKAQVRKYIRELKEKRAIAQKKLDEELKKAKESGEFEKEEIEIVKLEKMLEIN